MEAVKLMMHETLESRIRAIRIAKKVKDRYPIMARGLGDEHQ